MTPPANKNQMPKQRNSITFSIVEGGSWAKTSDDGLSGDWKGTFVTATPVAARP